jgi:hypothetical protein
MDRILAEHFGVDEEVIRKCVEMTKKQLHNVSASDIYECVMASGSDIWENLPEETREEIFSHLSVSEFSDMCNISRSHANMCKNPQYWIRYLSHRSKEDWISVIKHFASKKELKKSLAIIIKAYQKMFDENYLEVLFSVADTYDVSIDYMDSDLDMIFGRIESTLPLTEMNTLEEIVSEKRYDHIWNISRLGRYLKLYGFHMSRKISTEHIYKIEEVLDYTQEELNNYTIGNHMKKLSALELAVSRYFTSFQGAIIVFGKFARAGPRVEMALKLLSEGYYIINMQLAKNIIKDQPSVMDKLDDNIKIHIQKLLEKPHIKRK